MRRPVGADEPRPVERKAHRQALDGDVVHDLVVGALQERRVDGRKRLEPLGSQPAGERHRVLLGDPDVEGALGKLLGEEVEARAVRHRRGDGDDLVVLPRLGDEALGEHARVGRRVRLRLHLRAGDDVELGDAVILVVGGLRRRVALALLGHDVHEDRPLLGVAHVLQDGQQVIEVVPVDRADVVEAQLLEPRAALPEMTRVFLHARGAPLPALRQLLGELLGDVAQVEVRAARGDAREVGAERARRRRDRHVVVVQDDDEALIARTRVVQGLVGHAGPHGAVADHADDVVLAAREVARHRHAEAGGDRGRGVGGAERVVLALAALGEPRQAARSAQRADAVAPPGDDLVRIGLVADVPDEAVVRRVEHPVQRHGELDDAEAGAQMPARDRDGVDRLLAQLVGELAKLCLGKLAEVRGGVDLIEKGRFRSAVHRSIHLRQLILRYVTPAPGCKRA